MDSRYKFYKHDHLFIGNVKKFAIHEKISCEQLITPKTNNLVFMYLGSRFLQQNVYIVSDVFVSQGIRLIILTFRFDRLNK